MVVRRVPPTPPQDDQKIIESTSPSAPTIIRMTPIVVSTIYPGYIRSEINAKVKRTPFMVDTETGCRALVKAIESEKAEASVPAWPWSVIGWALRNLPASVTKALA